MDFIDAIEVMDMLQQRLSVSADDWRKRKPDSKGRCYKLRGLYRVVRLPWIIQSDRSCQEEKEEQEFGGTVLDSDS